MDFIYDGPHMTTISTPIEAAGKATTVNKASRKVGALTSSGDASIE
jgi:hypothetical protein